MLIRNDLFTVVTLKLKLKSIMYNVLEFLKEIKKYWTFYSTGDMQFEGLLSCKRTNKISFRRDITITFIGAI